MKRNLVKILALSAIVLALGACNKNGNSSQPGPSSDTSTEPAGPAELTILEVFELNGQNFLHEGEEIVLKQQCIYGNYGNTYIAGVPYEAAETILDFKGLEVELSETPDWKGETLGRYANVDVTGTLENVQGRPVLKNASLTINAEAQYDEAGERVDNDGAYSAGYWGKKVFKREYFDEYMGRNMNGTMFEGIFQLASKPETVSATSGSSFYVTFPGEDLDVTDEDNDSLVLVEIPEGLNENAVTKINTFFASAEVGAFIDMMGLTRWDTSKGGMCLLAENWWGFRTKAADKADIPTLYENWAKVKAALSPLYENAVIDLSAADENDALGAPFNFLIDTDDYAENPKDYWVDDVKDIFVTVADPESCGLVKITANYKPAKAAAYKAALLAKMEALGYTRVSSNGYEVFSLAVSNIVVENLVVAFGESYANLYYTAQRIITDMDFNTFALAKAAYEARLQGLFQDNTIESALPAVENAAFAKVNFDWYYETYYYAKYSVAVLAYTFEVSFAQGVTAEQKTALVAEYTTALKAASFAEDYYYSSFGALGLWNEASGEFVTLGLNKAGNLSIDVFYIFGVSEAANVVPKPTSDAELLAMINGEYAGWNGASATYFPTAACSLTSFTLGELAAVDWSVLDTTNESMEEDKGYAPAFSADITYSRALTDADVQALVAMLTGLGFVPATHSGYGQGYWKASTYEFIQFSVKGAVLTLNFVLVPTVMAGSTVQVAAQA